jgi:diphthamide synthase (EF-2-diphthine--ammonia ligase)
MQMLRQQYGITQLVTGDILDVAGGFMQRAVEGTGVELVTPLWQLPRAGVLAALFALRIDSIISCINVAKYGQNNTTVPRVLDVGQEAGTAAGAAGIAVTPWDAVALLLGKPVTPELVAGPLAEAQQLFGADLCGELGEYHTLVLHAPLFSQAVELAIVEVLQSGDYAYVVWDVSST